jgi:integrase/recombinase XerD
MNFRAYLTKENLSKISVVKHLEEFGRYQNWIKQEQLEIDQINYRELLSYIQEGKNKNIKPQTINKNLNTITKYYNYLIEEGIRIENPARKLRVKGTKRTVLADRLKAAELQGIYHQYKELPNTIKPFREAKQEITHQRNLIIISLLINQGVRTTTLKKIEVSHINFDKGEIYISGTKRSNSRTLKLHANQIIPLHTYVLQTREKLNLTDDYLFSRNTINIMSHLVSELKGMNPMIRNLEQIRASVIMNWIKHHNIRKVQYMAGHKYISSTEKYRQQDVESLQKALEKYHPMG